MNHIVPTDSLLCIYQDCQKNSGRGLNSPESYPMKQAEAFAGNTNFESEITCPWCGSVRGDSWEAEDEDTDYCENCENEYSHTRNVEVTYCTSKIILHQ